MSGPSAGTRARLLAVARAEFTAHGFAATGVRRIARRAGVDPALLYHYSRGEDDLARHVLHADDGAHPTDADIALAARAVLDGVPGAAAVLDARLDRATPVSGPVDRATRLGRALLSVLDRHGDHRAPRP